MMDDVKVERPCTKDRVLPIVASATVILSLPFSENYLGSPLTSATITLLAFGLMFESLFDVAFPKAMVTTAASEPSRSRALWLSKHRLTAAVTITLGLWMAYCSLFAMVGA